MISFFRISAVFLGAAALSACGGGSTGGAREQIRAVGSSTVYPFSTAVAEAFTKANPGFKSPIIESTGTGAGMKLFCAGVGIKFPDMENASRRIKKSEYEDCAKNGVKDIVEVHMRDIFLTEYPWRRLLNGLVAAGYRGFCLAEIPESSDPVRVMRYFKSLWLAYQGLQ